MHNSSEILREISAFQQYPSPLPSVRMAEKKPKRGRIKRPRSGNTTKKLKMSDFL